MREFAVQFYKSQAWKDCSDAYKASVGYLCERCKRNGLLTPGEIVHHKIHLTPENINNPDITLSWDNFECLCRQCHGDMHKKIQRRYRADADGRITPTD